MGAVIVNCDNRRLRLILAAPPTQTRTASGGTGMGMVDSSISATMVLTGRIDVDLFDLDKITCVHQSKDRGSCIRQSTFQAVKYLKLSESTSCQLCGRMKAAVEDEYQVRV